ncbi:MAG: cytochrome c3 family protein, partial [Myxococcota bacterium]
CHDGRLAPGKSSNHLPTSNRCEDCHPSTESFGINRMNHVGITNGCFTCHNNVLVSGKPPNHIPAPNTCEDCHNTNTWTIPNP